MPPKRWLEKACEARFWSLIGNSRPAEDWLAAAAAGASVRSVPAPASTALRRARDLMGSACGAARMQTISRAPILDILGEIGVGELTAGKAEAGKLELRHADTKHRERSGDMAG
jgi:hypothetical protein